MFDDFRSPLLGAGYLDPREAESHAHAARARIAREWDKALEETQRARRLQDTQQNPSDDSQASDRKPSSQSVNSAAEIPDSGEKQADARDEGIVNISISLGLFSARLSRICLDFRISSTD